MSACWVAGRLLPPDLSNLPAICCATHALKPFRARRTTMKRMMALALLAGLVCGCASVKGVSTSHTARVEGAPGSANDIATGGAGNRVSSDQDGP